MNLVYGTKNQGKLASMKNCLQTLTDTGDLQIVGLNELNRTLPEAEEEGETPLENAGMKALFYYRILNTPVFSGDSGLYFQGLPEELQPGLQVRRVKGKRLDDREMIQYYAGLAKRNGGKLIGQYRNGISLVIDEEHRIDYDGDDIASKPFFLTDTPHEKCVAGLPLDSLSVDPDTGRYFYDQAEEKNRERLRQFQGGFLAFFRRAMPLLSSWSR